MDGVVAIVGRPNVGKSTLFNRLIQKRKAIVDSTDGVTRDRLYGTVTWANRSFTVIDTGGIMIHPKDHIEENIRKQAHIAIEEADIILFLVDVTTGPTQFDEEIAATLKRSDKPVLLMVNKVDNNRRESAIFEFHSLGLGEPYSISAISGRSSGDLLDKINSLLPENPKVDEKEYDLKFALLGMPNAGKSTIANTFLNQERHIVTDIPGTTRDSIGSEFNYQKKSVLIVDTAGIRKRNYYDDQIEFYSSVRSLKAIDESDVCILVVDTIKGFGKGDIKIITEVLERGKGLIVAMNKWDAVEKDMYSAQQKKEKLIDLYPPLQNYPIFFISATKKQRLFKVLDEAFGVKERCKSRIQTSELNDFFQSIFLRKPAPSKTGKFVKIKYITQLTVDPPLIGVFANDPKLIPESYKRFLENEFRKKYDFSGVPIRIIFKQK